MKKLFQLRVSRIKAFTIIEVIVTLMLSSLIFSISLVVYRIAFNHQMRQSEIINNQMIHLSLKNLLRSDMERSNFVALQSEGFDFSISDNNKIRYWIADSVLIRENEWIVRDTFQLKELSIDLFFENSVVSEYGMLIDEVAMSFYFGELLYIISEKKIYDASTLVRLNY